MTNDAPSQSTEAAAAFPRGDGPCFDCGTLDNIVWFTDSELWNSVMDPTDDRYRILCIPCFVVRAVARGQTAAWKLIPDPLRTAAARPEPPVEGTPAWMAREFADAREMLADLPAWVRSQPPVEGARVAELEAALREIGELPFFPIKRSWQEARAIARDALARAQRKAVSDGGPHETTRQQAAPSSWPSWPLCEADAAERLRSRHHALPDVLDSQPVRRGRAAP